MSTVTLTEKNYKEFVKSEGVVLVDFWADWCAPCRAMKPIIEGIAKTTEVRVGLVDVDEEASLASDNRVSSIPHLLIFKDGEEVDKILGVLPPAALKEKLESYL